MPKRQRTDGEQAGSVDLLGLIKSQDGSKFAEHYTGFTLEGQSVGQVETRLISDFLKFESSKTGKKIFSLVDSRITLHESLGTFEQRTAAFDDVAQSLVDKGFIKRKKNELYAVSGGWGKEALCLIDRNAAPLFGITSIGVHLNCIVRKKGELHVWVQRRSPTKDHFPNCIDPTVAGGQPHGLSLRENMCKESNEEAGIEDEVARTAASVGVITKMGAGSDGSKLKQR
jgi:hypothetical protein